MGKRRQVHPYMPPDSPALQRFFIPRYAVNAKDYTPAELTGTPDLELWNCSFLEHDTLMAVMKIVGFEAWTGQVVWIA